MPDSKVSAKSVSVQQQLFDSGFCLFPLVSFPSPDCKKPAIKKWQKTAPGVYGPHNLPAGANYGVALKAGDLVVDVDPRNGGFDSFNNLLDDIIALDVPSFTVETGSGGFHLYLSKSPDIAISKHLAAYPGIDFLSAGCYVVGPGSRHPEGGEYTVKRGWPDAIADAPEALLAIIRKENPEVLAPSEGNAKGGGTAADEKGATSRFSLYLDEVAPVAIEGQNGDDTAYKVACYGRDLGLPLHLVSSLMASSTWNARCVPPWTTEELDSRAFNAFRYASGVAGAKDPARDFDGIPPTPEALRESVSEIKERKDKDLDWHMDAKGEKALKGLHNLLIYLRLPGSPLKDVFGYNEFTGEIEVTRPAPWHNGKMPRHPGIVDHDLVLLKAYLAKKHKFELSLNIIQEGVTGAAYENRFHPVREYLRSLEWDGKPRLDTWLVEYCGSQDNDYTRACARKTLCAAVARVFNPGCKFDHILVLEGDQGTGKSWLCAALGGEWSGDFIIDPHNKDTIQSLQGKWIVEMSEMEVTRRSDANALKAFISRQTDKARLAYQRLAAEFPRQCIFIGTINPDADGAWLKDDTGNRRFWPVLTMGQINVRGIKAVRNQLFAEAVATLEKGEKLFMEDKNLNELAQKEAAQRHAVHPWAEQIGSWLSSPAVVSTEGGRPFITAREIYLEAMGGLDKQLGRKETLSIAVCMKHLGWKKTVKARPGLPAIRGYSAPMSVADMEGLLGDLV